MVPSVPATVCCGVQASQVQEAELDRDGAVSRANAAAQDDGTRRAAERNRRRWAAGFLPARGLLPADRLRVSL